MTMATLKERYPNIVAAVGEVVKTFDFDTDWGGAKMSFLDMG
jgi:hypothetical protein